MKCPYCDKDMEKGTIRGEGFALRFFYEHESSSIFRFSKKGKKLGKPSFLQAPYLEAYYCQDCKKIIADAAE